LDSAFLDTVTNSQESAWSATVLVGKTEVQFKLDTGAAVTAITEETYKSLKSVTLKKPSKLLYGPARQELEVLGQFTEHLTHQQNSMQGDIYVVRGLKANLLGLPAITSLQLIQRLCTVRRSPVTLRNSFQRYLVG